MSEITCSFCRGTGKDPFGIMSWQSVCAVCGGKGVIDVPKPYRACPHCDGTGAVKTFTCTSCKGKGYVPVPSSPIVNCPECRGSGDDASNSSLDCLKCRGKGFVIAGRSAFG
jgi:DnaJ-class molecular chaperone